MGALERQWEDFDVWKWMTDGQLQHIDLEQRTNQIWTNMTHVYPSPRLERLFTQWSARKNHFAINHFLRNFCSVSPFDELTFIWQHLKVMGPSSSPERFQKRKRDSVFHVKCE